MRPSLPARSEHFPWPSHYGHFKFFEDRMADHSRVRKIESAGNGLYHLTLSDSREMTVFICECYSYGTAEFIETVDNLGKLDAVVINSNWCGYTDELKLQCRNDGIGLFDIRDFMAAINKNEFWLYLNEHDKESFKKRGLI